MTVPMGLPAYAELHCLSNFSFLRGASHPEELVGRALELGYQALAITDECSLAGVVQAHQAAKAAKLAKVAEGASAAGLKLLIGAEFVLAGGLKLVLLAQNRAGYGNLAALITLARRRAGKGSYYLTRGDLDGLGAAGAVPDCLALWVPPLPEGLAGVGDVVAPATVPPAAPGDALTPLVECGRWLAARFPGRLWLAAELHAGANDAARLATLQALGAACHLPLVAAGDVHMHRRGRRALQDTLTALRLKTTVFAAGHALFPNGERHLRSRLRLARLYPPELLAETLRLVELCNFSLDELRYEYPEEIVPHGLTPATYLRQEVEAGLRVRYPDGVPGKVQERVEHELALIAELVYEAYFLTVYDIVRFARGQGILCQGRGSAANSAVCYALGITEVNPAASSLLFERFLSKERNEPPDIDVDFEHERREEVIQYIYGKYGRERAALAAALITYRTRGALRDAGRALGFEPPVIDALAASMAWWDRREQLPERLQALGLDPASPRVSKWLALTEELVGFPRHLSQHVGGFVISRGPLSRLVPIENAAMADRSVIQWNKDDLEALGLLKVDVLALGMLSCLRRALDLLGARRGAQFRLQDIPREDPAVYAMLCRADSMGVFQVESRAQMAMLPRLAPQSFYDLVVEVALVRPGPIQGDMVHPYLKRRHGKEPIEKMTPEVEAVLGRTYGVPIFQEQVMALAVAAAGFTPGEADQLRRSMAAWRKKGGLEHFEQKLIDGMRERHYPEEFARRIFAQIQGFGEYGFPESHAASFANLVYFSAWLKRHEPAVFLCALLNSQPMGFYSPAQLVQDARRHGVAVRPVDVLESCVEATLEADGGVRLGLQAVRGLSGEAAARLVAVRRERPFASLADLLARTGLARRDLDCLAAADALHGLAGHRRQAAWEVAGAVVANGVANGVGTGAGKRSAKGAAKAVGRGGTTEVAMEAATGVTSGGGGGTASAALTVTGDLFAALASDPTNATNATNAAVPAPIGSSAPVELPVASEGENLVADYASLGLSLRRHPLALLRERLTARRFLDSATLNAAPDRQLARAAGIVVGRQRPGTASGIVFVTLEDEHGNINVVIHPHLVDSQRRELLGARLLGVYGQVQREGRVVHLVAKRLVDLSELLGRLPTASRDFH